MFRFKCVITRTGKRPVTRTFKCRGSSEAKAEAGKFLPPHLYKQAWRKFSGAHWRKESDWCSVVLTEM